MTRHLEIGFDDLIYRRSREWTYWWGGIRKLRLRDMCIDVAKGLLAEEIRKHGVCRTSHDALRSVLAEIHKRHRLTGSYGDIPAFVEGVVIERDRLRAERDKLRAALEQYGDHTVTCVARDSRRSCTCGSVEPPEPGYGGPRRDDDREP